MPESVFEKYYQQRIKNIFNLLHDVELSGTETALHDLRVELKKLKSVLQFIRTIYNKDRIRKSAKKLNHFFHQAGEIRESQLMRKWLLKKGYPEIAEPFFAENRIEMLIQDFRTSIHHFKKDLRELDEQIKEPVQKINKILILHHIDKLKSELDDLLASVPEEAQWHAFRKQIKKWIYAMNWMDGLDQKDLAVFQKLQEMIGNWHDQLAMQEWLKLHEKEIKSKGALQHAFALAIASAQRSSLYHAKRIRSMMREESAA